MKKLTLIMACLLLCGLAFGDSNYLSENANIFGPNMGSIGITPPQMIVKCSLGSDDSGTIGDVLVWDVTVSTISDGAGLGYVVRICDINHASDDQDVVMGQYTGFAGVLVTKTSQDSQWSAARASGPEVGYMAVKGYVDAKIMYRAGDETILGRQLVLTGATLAGSFGTIAETTNAAYHLSEDIGILLEFPASDGGLAKVWLH